jgi:hypothetical protein
MNSLTIILGAGFSAIADLPTGRDINNKFLGEIKNNLYCNTIGSFSWRSKNNINLYEDQIKQKAIISSYILNTFLEEYLKLNKSSFNYEKFYQFYFDSIKMNNSYLDICKKAKEIFFSEFKEIDEKSSFFPFLSLFDNPLKRDLISMFNNLIGDLLHFDKEKINNKYYNFITYISQFDIVNIFTLNHDLLLEFLLYNVYNISFSDGFSQDNSVLRNGKRILRVFNNNFDSKINIYKIHGSIDNYVFNYFDEDGLVSYPREEYIYYKAENVQDILFPERFDPISKKTIQSRNPYSSPAFITGVNKVDIINKDYMYSKINKHLEDKIKFCSNVLVFGYSFQDKHINEKIQNLSCNSNLKTIININRSKKFPLELFNSCTIKNLNSTYELI